MCGQREQDHGNPENNFSTIANLWNEYISAKHGAAGVSLPLDGKDVAVMMALLKIARIATGTGTEDSFVDLAGYAACGAEFAK